MEVASSDSDQRTVGPPTQVSQCPPTRVGTHTDTHAHVRAQNPPFSGASTYVPHKANSDMKNPRNTHLPSVCSIQLGHREPHDLRQVLQKRLEALRDSPVHNHHMPHLRVAISKNQELSWGTQHARSSSGSCSGWRGLVRLHTDGPAAVPGSWAPAGLVEIHWLHLPAVGAQVGLAVL